MFRLDEDMAARPTAAGIAKTDKPRLVRRMRNLAGVFAAVFWVAWGAVTMSWPGARPMVPDAGHPYAYTSNGLFYVSAGDLVLSYGLLVCAAAMVVAVAVLHRAAFKLAPHADTQ